MFSYLNIFAINIIPNKEILVQDTEQHFYSAAHKNSEQCFMFYK